MGGGAGSLPIFPSSAFFSPLPVSESQTQQHHRSMREKTMGEQTRLIPEVIARRILLIRGQKVILDFDLARLYEVETKVLLQAVKRNIGRFPDDFMFQLTEYEFRGLRSQFVTSKG